MQGGDGRRSTGSARGTFMVQMGGFPSLWPLPDELPLLYHHQGHQRLHRCAGFPTSYTRDLFVNHGVLRVLHPPVLLKLSHFPAVFTQALIPSLIHILHTGPHTNGALQGWTDDCSYFSIFKSMSCSISLHLRASLHCGLVNADIF